MKRLLFIFFAAAALLCRAQKPAVAPTSPLDAYMESGMEVQGIRVPFYDKDGALQAQLYGGHAKVLDRDRAEITNLRIDVYQDGVVVMTIFAPHCFTQMDKTEDPAESQALVVYSDGDVLIDSDSMSVYGKGFKFYSVGSHFEIFENAKVMVKQGARDLSGVAW